ncbi:MAG: hypothetical protein CME85_08710 [Henriciella sp.]|uniref:MFS transporter n=1 Tax=Henriciella sp. TaxID=1968823 RepID=UPI000C0FC679|nr:MFS transporter [Henriciella sp.]MAN73843.1 hypothetical protein [Henriciella sp.]MBF34664.1 hypothetical protein [Hyphomonadaceae bacterium]MBK75565.1 hypothetical protein [Henriciella sp.]PHR73985.1 MAG: hypothetical protein COA64_14580 [Henriciella sp.]|tara:strand:+ start:6007 stop:7398 length:1392 start_codon:yes stop_codon:yes gene_type:complete
MSPATSAKKHRFPLTGFWWASFDWARSPYYYIVIIYVFSAYFAESVVGDSTRGQAIFSSIATVAGLIMAVAAPFLGGFMDRGGAKKPVLFALMLILAAASAGLALVAPGVPYAIPLAGLLLVISSCAYTVSELFHNALLPAAGTPRDVPLISGLGLSMGSGASVVALLILIYLLNHPPAGLLEQDIARLSGAFCGAWILLFMAPFFLGMPDLHRPGASWRRARFLPETLRPMETLRTLFTGHPSMMRFLIARMIFMDGLTALFTIGAVYVAGVLGWSPAETAAMGILATVSAVLGGLVGGVLDRLVGPRRAILIELFCITAIFAFQVGMTKTTLLFGLVHLPVSAGKTGMFANPTDVVYLISIMPLSAFIIGAYSSCRSLLVALSPPDRIGQFFGIYAMTGTVTVWLGPGLVSVATMLSGSQRIGFGSLIILFVLGSLLMLRVRDEPAVHGPSPETLMTPAAQ